MSQGKLEIVEQVSQLIVSDTESVIETVEEVTVLELGTSGPQGAQGPAGQDGATGPQGPAGPTLAFVYHQDSVSALWTVVHGLGIYPQVTVQDSAGTTVEGDVTYVNNNSLTISFGAAFSGTAYLS